MKCTTTTLITIIVMMVASMVFGDVPPFVNYQGRLTDVGGNPMDTTIAMTFSILNDSAGADTIWTETHPSVIVDDGLFQVKLGWYNFLPDSVFDNDTRWLAIEVGGEEISPQTRLISVPYTFHAKSADTAAVALSGPAGNSGWSDDGTTVRLTTSTDNVGIGTSSPSEKLDVTGNIHASGMIKSGSSITIDGTTDEITASGGVIGFDDEDLESGGDIRLGNTSGITDGIKLGIRENLGTVSPFIKFYVESTYPSDLLNSAFEIYSPAYDYTPIKILGAGAIIQETSNKIGRAGTIVNQISPVEGDATFFNAGNVGIGTDIPSEALEVAGTIYSTSGGFRFPDGSVQTTAAGGGITGVYGTDGLTGGGSSGDISLLIADGGVSEVKLGDNSVTSAKIIDGEIADWDISPSADIAVEKISGTAVNVTGYQTITGEKTFNNNVNFQDSTMIVRNYGVGMGNPTGPDGISLLKLKRTWGGDLTRYGQEIDVSNSGAGNLWGLFLQATNTNPSADLYSNNVNGIRVYSTGNTDFRTGIYSWAKALTDGISTGYTVGVHGEAKDGQIAYGIYGAASGAITNWSGYFEGDVQIGGTLYGGKGLVRVDHPLDPENMYLDHALIGSNEMKNLYDGTVITDDEGLAVVELPEYVEAINVDFRYQLTVIGTFAQAIILEEIRNNQFVIKTDQPNVKVCWLVTGIRSDAWSKANPMEAEKEKPAFEKGRYLHPEVFGLGEEMNINYEMNKQTKEISE